MIRNLLNGFRLGFAYFSVGTVIAQVVIVASLFWKSGLTPEKYNRLIAHLRGIDTLDLIVKEGEVAKAREQEAKVADLQSPLVVKRKEALKIGLDQVKISEALISGNRKQYDKIRTIFTKRLNELEVAKVTQARKTVQQTLEVIDPELAKDLIMQILEDAGAEATTAIIVEMPADRQKKIFAEFTTPEELEAVNQLLSQLRMEKVVPTSNEGVAL